MSEDMFKMLDAFREHVTREKEVDRFTELEKDINEQLGLTGECAVRIPEAMIDFYRHFGNDKSFLRAYYCFDKVEEVCVENGELMFGYSHQYASRLGIPLADLNTGNEKVCETPLKVFLFHIAVWQIINTRTAMATVEMNKQEFESFMKKGPQYFSDSEVFTKDSRFRAAWYQNILMCYIEEETMYVSAKEDEELQEFEEAFKLDLDWC